MKLRVFRIDLPLIHFKITRESTISVVRTIVVELEQDGLRGYGEVCEESILGTRVETLTESIERIQPDLSRYALADPRAFSRYIEKLLPNNSARCAVEEAACDLWGKLQSFQYHTHWQGDRPIPISSYSITQDSVTRALEKFDEVPDWPLYRIEMGSRGDIVLLEELRKRTDARFRCDFGGNWEYEEVLDALDPLQELGVEMIEQPLPPKQWGQMKILKENSPIPFYADESCLTYEDIDRCATCFDGVNLRLLKFGGLIPTYNAIMHAKKLGLKTMIGTPFESVVSSSIAAQLAPLLDDIYVDGPLLVGKRFGRGIELDHGKIIYPDEDGCGIRVITR